MKNCFNDYLIVYQGYPTLWNGIDWLSISFKSEFSLDGFRAIFKVGDYSFETSNLLNHWIINLTKEQTSTLPLGINNASLIVYDYQNNGKPFTTSIPVMVKDWVKGDIKIDRFNMSIDVKLDSETQFVVNVKTIAGYEELKEELNNFENQLNQKQDIIPDLEEIRQGAEKGETAVQPDALNDYATTQELIDGLATKQPIGDYATKQELNTKQDKGNYALKSEIPTQTSQLTNNSDFTTKAYVDDSVAEKSTVIWRVL